MMKNKAFEVIKKYILPIANIIAIILIVIMFISNLVSKPLDYIVEELNNTKKEVEIQKTNSENLLQDLKNMSLESATFRKQSEMYRQQLQTLKNTPNFEGTILNALVFNETFALFNENFAKKNEQTFISLNQYYDSLTVYETKLNEYKKEIDKNAMKCTLSPYALFGINKTFGGGIDLTIPITHTFSISGGIGYFNTFYFKIGVNFKL